jgi:hypothetical protein
MKGFGSDGKPRWSDGEPLTSMMDNVLASKMGEALCIAEKASYGDLIDRGLSLRRALEENGFEVREKP